ncbi:MAG: hypothetical protein L6R38_008931, partial [Xanthoria sp. 2 TBL-2021]
MVDGGVGERTVGPSSFHFTSIPTDYRLTKAQALHNLLAVLEAAGSSLRNVVECNVFLTDMTNFAAMNRVYDTFFEKPKPVGHYVHDSEKSPPKISKRSKKPDAASRPYRANADVQDQSDSSDAQAKKPTQPSHGSPARKRKNDRLQDTASKRTTATRRPAPLSRGPVIGKRPILHVPGPHIITDTKTGESIWLPAEPDIPTDLPKWHLEEDINPFTGDAPPVFRLKSVEELYQEILECPYLRFDHRGIEELLADAQPRTPDEMAQCYHDLRSAAWKWAKDTFQYESSTPLDLMELATSHPELMEYINSTTASPQLTSWETLLQKKRAAIVYSILGKVLDIHVFGEELFGASPEQKYTLRASDRE